MKLEIIIPLMLAIIGYFFTYFYRLLLAKRSDKLRFIERQINEFYGPLYITGKVGKIMLEALRSKRDAFGIRFLNEDSPKSKEDISEWRIWVENIFMPLNRKRQEIIIDKAHLIREEEIPFCLLQFITHVAGYEALLNKWEKDDFSESVSFFAFPYDLDEYSEKSYLVLKKNQLKLLGKF